MPWYIWIITVYFIYSIISGALLIVRRSDEDWDIKQTFFDFFTKILGLFLVFEYGFRFMLANENYTTIIFYTLIASAVATVAFEIKEVFFEPEEEKEKRMAEIGKEIVEKFKEAADSNGENKLEAATTGIDQIVEEYNTEKLGDKVGFLVMLAELGVLIWLGTLAMSITS